MPRSLILIGALAGPAPAPADSPPPSEPPVERPAGQGFRTVLASVAGLDNDATFEELGLRLGHLEIRRRWAMEADAAPDPTRLFIRLTRAQSGRVRIEVITGDGRAFLRESDGGEQPERVATSVAANLLIAIEESTVEPDVEDAALPRSNESEDVDAAVAALVPAPAPAPAEPAPDPEPPPPETSGTEPPPIEAVPPPPPTWQLGLGLHPTVLLAVGPPVYAGVFQAGGADVDVVARHRSGGQVGLAIRPTVRHNQGFALTRLRIALGGGYAPRVQRFELPITGALFVEPYWMRDDGEPLEFPELAPILAGFALRFEPGILIPVEGLGAVRVGAHAELAATGAFDGGLTVAGIASPDEEAFDDRLFRMGGVEASVGLGTRIWFDLRPSQR